MNKKIIYVYTNYWSYCARLFVFLLTIGLVVRMLFLDQNMFLDMICFSLIVYYGLKWYVTYATLNESFFRFEAQQSPLKNIVLSINGLSCYGALYHNIF